MQDKANKSDTWISWAFWTIYAGIFALVCYKSFTVPITHDEAWTVLRYLDESNWNIMMYPDSWPNNHILNTLLAKGSAGIFGIHDWSVRLPNLLFFWVYAFGVYRFLKCVFQERMLLFLPAAAIFILSPYFLDFFGLCRGYGISSALTMLSVSYFVTGFSFQKYKHIWLAFGMAIIASYANFTVLVYLAAAFGMATIYFLLHRTNWTDFLKKLSVMLLVLMAYAALIYTPIYKMKSTNQFEFWTSKGFYEETVFSVIHNSLTDSSLYTRQEWFAILVVIITLVLWLVGLNKIRQTRNVKNASQFPVVIVGALLFATVLVNVLQTNILGDPNLNGRTALFLLPIFSALAVIGLTFLPKEKMRGVSFFVGGLLLLITLQHWTMSYRANSFREWWYDQHTIEVLDYLEQKEGQQSLRIDWAFRNSFEFYEKFEPSKNWLLVDNNIGYRVNPEAKVDYYYVPDAAVADLQSNFEVEKIFDGGQVLMRRK